MTHGFRHNTQQALGIIVYFQTPPNSLDFNLHLSKIVTTQIV